MTATVLVAAVISSLFRLWYEYRWIQNEMAKNDFGSFARVKVNVCKSLQMFARKDHVPS